MDTSFNGSRNGHDAESTPSDTVIDALNSLWLIPPSHEKDPGQLERDLHERIKELNCLYAITRLSERHADSMERFLSDVVTVLPPSWQFSDETEACITFQNRTYETPQFGSTAWQQSAPIEVHGDVAGTVTVVYRKPYPAAFEGPFLRE